MFKILLVFFLISLLEVYLFIRVGHIVGAGWTVFFCFGTAVLGGLLVRHQGFQILYKVQSSMQQGQLPAQQMLEGVCLCISGILLFTPGFFTDTLGFLLLIPALRNRVVKVFVASSKQTNLHPDDEIIEGEVINKDKSLPK